MNILMISLDKALVGRKSLGDAVERHKKYGSFVDRLDIIAPTSRKDNLSIFKMAENVYGYPSNSFFKIFFIFDAIQIALKINKKNKIDLIVCQEPFITGLTGWFIKKISGAKLLIHFHGDFWENKYWLKESFFNPFFLLISKFVVPRADAIRAVSQGIKEKIMRSGIAQEKIHVIPTPVDLKKFEYKNQEKINEIKKNVNNKKIILYVGRLVREKNLGMLIDAFKIVNNNFQDCVLMIVGDGIELENLKNQVLKLDLKNKVFFQGSINSDELSNYYYASEIFVLASSSESFGKVLVEAGITNTPSVATKTTGAREIIKDKETGLLVNIDDKNGFSDKILYLLQNPEICDKMGKQAKIRINKYFGDTTEKIIELWKSLI
jgi:glycosyltransferase involved in cell wall biosynthesis